MMRLAVFLFSLALAVPVIAQEAPARMTQARLHQFIAEHAQEVSVQGNVVTFRVGEARLVGVSDAAADRMRFLAPIMPPADVSPEELIASLIANFHTMLDARYAVSKGIVFAAFLHPLSPLTAGQVVSAMRQVAAARESFGTDFSSGGPAFPAPR